MTTLRVRKSLLETFADSHVAGKHLDGLQHPDDAMTEAHEVSEDMTLVSFMVKSISNYRCFMATPVFCASSPTLASSESLGLAIGSVHSD